ncbi:parallel beta-helix repeat (two copies) [Halopelagius inordinatus]|uniref:Parallel beta-helix repeat (Two copies) n=1 Tax=Halopelagius inordinatus TaxID=553467 RepID=A0A1I2LX37_9EURY|nr:NosD domain-containing protein [Halopelagius inordinatus]SFF83784.1 parallel beta-helix repeat (two copies) [Halopelagius inordinatus]
MGVIAGGMTTLGGLAVSSGTAGAAGDELEGVAVEQSCSDGMGTLRLRNPNSEPVGVIAYGPDADGDGRRERYDTTLDAAGAGDAAEFPSVPTGTYTVITRILDGDGEMVPGPTGRIEEASVELTCPPASPGSCLVLDESRRYTLDEDVDCIEITADNARLDAGGYLVNEVLVRADGVTVRNVGGASEFAEGAFTLDAANHCRIAGNTVGEGGFTLANSNHNVLVDNTKLRQGNGLSLEDSDRNYVAQNTFVGETTITLRGSDANVLVENETETEDFSLRLVESHENWINDNRIESQFDAGVTLARSHRNVLHGNDVLGDTVGISLTDADRNVVRENRFEGNGSGVGAELANADRNTLIRNRLSGYDVGIELVDSDRNRVLQNEVCGASEATRSDSDSTDNVVNATSTDCSDE